MHDEYQQEGARLLIIDLQNKHVGQLILTGHSHGARKDLPSTARTGGRWKVVECLSTFVFKVTVCDNDTYGTASFRGGQHLGHVFWGLKWGELFVL